MLCITCCVLHAVYYVLHAVCYMLCVTCCALHAVRYMLCVTCCALHAVRYMLCVTCCALHAVRYMLCVTCCALHAVRYMLCVTCCALHAVRYMLCVTCCALHAVRYMLCVTCCALHAVYYMLLCYTMEVLATMDSEYNKGNITQYEYRIAGIFRGVIFSWFSWSRGEPRNICTRKSANRVARPKPRNFFHEIAKITTFMKILPLEKYPLYGISMDSCGYMCYVDSLRDCCIAQSNQFRECSPES